MPKTEKSRYRRISMILRKTSRKISKESTKFKVIPKNGKRMKAGQMVQSRTAALYNKFYRTLTLYMYNHYNRIKKDQ